MHKHLRHSVWLLVGLTAAAVLAWIDLGAALGAAAAGLALHFRAHAVRMARQRDAEMRRTREAARRVVDIAEDLARSHAIIGDNLAEISLESASERSRLYLEGAQAHCRRLGDMSQRLYRIANGTDSGTP